MAFQSGAFQSTAFQMDGGGGHSTGVRRWILSDDDKKEAKRLFKTLERAKESADHLTDTSKKKLKAVLSPFQSEDGGSANLAALLRNELAKKKLNEAMARIQAELQEVEELLIILLLAEEA